MVDYWVMEKYLKYFRYVAITGIFIVPFIVLWVPGSLFFPFITGKNFAFRIITEIIFGCWAVLAIYDKKYRPGKSAILYFAGAFVAATALSTIFGDNPYRSFWSNYERMEGLVTFLHLFAYFLVLSAVLRTEKIWKIFLNVELGASLLVSFYGLFQITGALQTHQGVRLDATLGNSAYLAIYAVFHIFLAAFLFLREQSIAKWIYPPIMVLETFILYYTATRGAILGFVGGILLAAFLMIFLTENKKVKTFSAGALVGVIILIAGFWMARDSEFVKSSMVLNRFASISISEQTTQSRLVIWRMAWEGFKEKPVLGWGPENFNLVFNKHFQPILWKQEPWFDRAHNVFFDRLTTGGVVGLVTYLGLFGSAVFYLLFKRKNIGLTAPESATLVAMLAAYFVHNIFVFDNLISSILFFTTLAFLHRKIELSRDASVDRGGKVEKMPAEADYQKSALAVTVIILTIFSIYFVNVKPIATCRTLLKALGTGGSWMRSGDASSLKESLANFQNAIAYNSFGTTEAREQLVSLASKVISSQKVESSLKQEVYQYATEQMNKQILQAPQDVRYKIFLGSLYNADGQSDLAIEVMQKAIEIAPNKQQLYFELISAYLNKKDFTSAIEFARRAFELDTTYDDARKIYAAVLIYGGKEAEAEALIKERFGVAVILDDRILNAYASINKIGKVIEIIEMAVKNSPDDPNLRLKLAAAYSEIGQNEKAIKELQKVIELQPSFKQQGEYYIDQIKQGKKP